MQTTRYTPMRIFWTLSVIGLPFIASCGGGDSTGSTNNSVDTSDCQTQSSAVVLEVDDEQSDDSLLATAVTADCEELAVFADDTGSSLKQVAISGAVDTIILFDDNGDPVATRVTESGTDIEESSFTFNDSLAVGRVDVDGNAESFSVDRESSSNARRQILQADQQRLCEQLGNADSAFRSLLAACDGDTPPDFCGSRMATSARTVTKLCESDVEIVDQITGRTLGNSAQDTALGVDAYATTRPAAGGGQTIILSSVPFGGSGNVSVSWAQRSGSANATLQQLPGNAAVADLPTAEGTFEFEVTATDGNNGTATNTIELVLGSTSVLMSVTNLTPDQGEQVTFGATGESIPDEATYFWNFGDGSTVTGLTATHAYTAEGTYTVTLLATSGDRDWNSTTTVIVGEGSTEIETLDSNNPTVSTGDFEMVIDIGDPDFMIPGEMRTVSVEASNAQEPLLLAWGVIEGPGDVYDASIVPNAQTAFSSTPTLEAFEEEGIVLLRCAAVDAIGRVAIADRAVPVFGDEGGLYATILGPIELEVGTPTELRSFVIGGEGELSYEWFGDDSNSTLATPRESDTEITATVPGFAGINLVVSDSAGQEAFAFLGIEVLASGFGSLFVDFLGPFEVPVGQDVPLTSFINGGTPPYFCAWNVLDPFNANGFVLDPFECDPTFFAFEAGCTDIEIFVQDLQGNFGASLPLEICAGDAFDFDCPIDGFCELDCEGFDADCDSICPLDGVCDEFCPLLDPDCIENQFCIPGDSYCDSGCVPEDSDCSNCSLDGVCVFLCPTEDPDCAREVCAPNDGICDFGCIPEDSDCAGFCTSGDGICDFPCTPVDSDCDNQTICDNIAYCCDSDGLCDDPDCPSSDLDCASCTQQDSFCVEFCPVADPDCQFGNCPSDGVCDLTCSGVDLDCESCAFEDSFCIEGCLEPDPDCLSDNCPSDGVCDPNCAGSDLDCDLCGSDGLCIVGCPSTDPDCGSGACDIDGICNTECVPADFDCTNAEICFDTAFCCDQDQFCDIDACPELDGDCLFCGFQDGVCIAGECEIDPDC